MAMAKEKIFCTIAYFMLVLFEMAFIQTYTLPELSLAIIFNICVQIIILWILRISLYSIGPVFILMGQLFQFGIIILMALKYDFSSFVLYYLDELEESEVLRAGEFSFLCVSFLFLGFLLGNKKQSQKVRKDRQLSLAFYKNAGIIMTIGFGTVWLFVQIVNLYLSRNGYEKNAYNTLPSTIITLANFMYAGIFFLMVYYKKKKQMFWVNAWFIFALLLTVVSMLAGVRSMGMCIIVLLFIFYGLSIKKIDGRLIICISICGFFLLALLTAIMHLRSRPFSISALMSEWVVCIKSNIIFNAVEEFGMSIFILIYEMKAHMAGMFDFHYENIFLHELVVSIPGLPSLFPNLVGEGFIKLDLYGLGCSIYADVYYYLGNMSYLFFVFFGLYLSIIDNKLLLLSKREDYYGMACRWIFYHLILSEIRSAFRLGYKAFLLSIFVMWFIRLVLGGKYKNEESVYLQDTISNNNGYYYSNKEL